MVLSRGMTDACRVKKILLVVAAVIALFVGLKIVLALFSALIGMLFFAGVAALLGFGAYSVVRLVTRNRRHRSLV